MEELTGKIKRMFKGCPKPSGWFGCFFSTRKYGDIMLTGTAPFDVAEGMELIVKAEEQERNGGVQWVALSIEQKISGKTSIIKFLSGKNFAKIGKVKAEKIYNELGDSTLDIIKSYNTDVSAKYKLDHMSFLSEEDVNTLAKGIMSYANTTSMISLLPTVSLDVIKDINSKYEVKDIVNNPYILCEEFNIPFNKVDAIAMSNIGISPLHPTRVNYITYYALISLCRESGHVYLNLNDFEQWQTYVANVVNMINNNNAGHKITPDMVSGLINKNNLVYITDYKSDKVYRMYPKKAYDAECNIAYKIKYMMNNTVTMRPSEKIIDLVINDYQNETGRLLDDDQRTAVKNAMRNNISVITGGPGCGKTTTTDCILYCYDLFYKNAVSNNKNAILNIKAEPALSAPTGKAVKRLSQQVNKRSRKYSDCQTIARRTITYKITRQKSQKTFYDNRLVIVDEASMIDLFTASDMLDIFEDARLILIGDINQLPSIDIGSFFASVCASDVPKVELSHCYRAQTSGKTIINNAKLLNQGISCESWTYDMDSFMFYAQSEDNDKFVNSVLQKYQDHLADTKNSSVNDILLVTPFNNSLVGAKSLNIRIQNLVNKEKSPVFVNQSGNTAITNRNGVTINDMKYFASSTEYTSFRVGDRVMYLHNDPSVNSYKAKFDNGFYEPDGDKQSGIFNGDTGTIVEYRFNSYDSKECAIKFLTDDDRLYVLDAEHFNKFALAYAVTVHKAQGCEAPVVMYISPNRLMSLPCNIQFATRNLLYTAITRASECVEIIGSKDALDKCVETTQPHRQSLLYRRIVD